MNSCGAWTAEASNRSSLKAQLLSWWVMGWVSGAASILADENVPLARTDAQGINQWITTYCTEHPLDPLPNAGGQLVDEMKKRAAK